MFNAVDSRLLGLVVAIVVLVVAELGYHVARRARNAGAGTPASAGVQAALFTVVGLMLAFSFNLSLNRYDARRNAVTTEANAIGTAIQRTELLDSPAAQKMHAYLKLYLDARIAFVEADADERARADATRETEALQREMWALTTAIARTNDRSTEFPLFVSSLNSAFDAAGLQSAVTLAHIPDSVMIVLITIVLIAVGVLGYNTGSAGERNVWPMLLLGVTMGLVIGIILDLDHPQGGLIQVNFSPLIDDRQLFDAGPQSEVVIPLRVAARAAS